MQLVRYFAAVLLSAATSVPYLIGELKMLKKLIVLAITSGLAVKLFKSYAAKSGHVGWSGKSDSGAGPSADRTVRPPV